MADNILKARVRHAYKTDAEWANANPILLKGEIAYSSDIRQTKTGDGTAHWADLEYDTAVPIEHEHTGLIPFITTVGNVTSSLAYFRVARIHLGDLTFNRDNKEDNWAGWTQHRLTLLVEGRFIGSGLINILAETNGILDVSDQTTQEDKITKYCNKNIVVKFILNGVPKEYVKSYAMILDDRNVYVDIWLRHGKWNKTSIYCLGRSSENNIALITDFQWMNTIASPDYTYYDTNESVYMYSEGVSTGQIETTGVVPKTSGNLNIGTSDKKWNNVYANTFQGNLNGSANRATKLATARNISANDDYIMNFNFDGSGNVSTQLRAYNAIIAVANTNNYPYHRFAKIDAITDSYQDRVTNLLITQDFNGGGWGICRIVLRTNNQSNTLSSASVDWLVRCGLAADSVQIGLYTKDGSTYADAFFKTVGTYWSTTIRNLGSGSRGNIGRTWTFINSSETNNTTTTDKKTSYEVYVSLADAGTALHNQAYTSTITGVDVGTVKYANTSGSATSAEKATKDSTNQQINTTYIKGISANGKTITVTKGDNKTGTATISGFVPMEGTTKDNPMTGAIIQSSTDNGNTYLAGYTPSGSRLITSSSSGTRTTELTPSSFTTNLETGDAETSGALDVTFYPQKNKQMIYLGGSSSDWIIRGVGTPVQDGDAVNKNYIDSTLENWSNDLVEELQGLIPVYGTWEDTPVTGNIVFNGKATVTGVKEPSSDSDVATKGYVDRQNSIKSVTLTAAGWTGTTAPYTQAVKVDGITEDDNPVMVSMLAAGATPDTQKAYNKAFGIICSGTGTTANDRVRFSVYSKPAIDITVGLKGV